MVRCRFLSRCGFLVLSLVLPVLYLCAQTKPIPRKTPIPQPTVEIVHEPIVGRRESKLEPAKEVIERAQRFLNQGRMSAAFGDRTSAEQYFRKALECLQDANVIPEEQPVIAFYFEDISKTIQDVTDGKIPAKPKTTEKLPVAACDMKASDAPEIRGLRLGMSSAEVTNVVKIPLTLISTKTSAPVNAASVDIGESGAVVEPDSPGFEGVGKMTLRFFKDKLIDIEVIYSEGDISWKDSAEFAGVIGEKLRLPVKNWELFYNMSLMVCQGFNVRAFATGRSASIAVSNRDLIRSLPNLADAEITAIKKREADAELQKKKAFKP